MLRNARPIRLLALVLGLALLGAACSRVGFFYDRADWLAYRWVDGLLDASSDQKSSWQEQFRQVMQQHRETLLPEIVLLLGLLEPQAERGLDRATLACWLQAAEQSYARHARLVIPTAVAVLQESSPQQLDYMSGAFAERNETYREDYLLDDVDARRAARVDRFVDRIEEWTGDLDTHQVRLVEETVGDMRDISDAWFEYRRQQQQRLLALLRDDVGEVALAAFLDDWWVDFGGRPAQLVEDAEHNRGRVLALILALDESLSDDQRAAFVDRVRKWRTGFEEVDPAAGRLWRTHGTRPVCAAVSAS
jgi:hypothetical protein